MGLNQDEGDLLLFGELLNYTGQTQELTAITGTFYDAGGKVITDGDNGDNVPIEVMPQGGLVPFKLTVPDIQAAADFDLEITAGTSSETVGQDFKFANPKPSIAAGIFCFTG